MYDAFVARVAARAGLPLEVERRGTLELAVSAEDEARLTAAHAALARERIGAKWLDASGVAKLEPSMRKDVRGAVLVPVHAAVHVPTLTAAQAEAARALGVTITTGVAATSLSDDGGRPAVHTAEGVLRAGEVVLAAGTWTPGLTVGGSNPLPVRPVRGQLLHLIAPPGTVRHILWTPDVYLVPFRDGTLLAGATTEHVGHDDRATAEGVSGLLAAAVAAVPALQKATFKARSAACGRGRRTACRSSAGRTS